MDGGGGTLSLAIAAAPPPSRLPNLFFVPQLSIPSRPTTNHPQVLHCSVTNQTKMVRIKNRYLLVNILYPELDNGVSQETPDLLAINQPTNQSLTTQILLKAIRAQVTELFGDYGAGAVSDSLMGRLTLFLHVNIH